MRTLRDIGVVCIAAAVAVWVTFCIAVRIIINIVTGDRHAVRKV